MTRLLTVEQLRGYIPDSAESDETLQARIEENEAELNRRFGTLTDTDGALDTITRTYVGDGTSLLALGQEAASVETLTIDGTEVETTEYYVEGRYLRRAWGRWQGRITVEYVPADARAMRRRVLVKLIQIDMNYEPGMGSQGAGGWNESYFGKSYDASREEVIATLGPEGELFA